MSSGEIRHDTTEPYAKAIAWAVALTALLLALVFVCSLWYYRTSSTDELNQKELVPVTLFLQSIRTYEDQELSATRWKDLKKDWVQVPIDYAMEKVVQDYRAK